MEITLVVMAAGLASRYGKLKQLEPIGPHGEKLVEYSVFNAIRAGINKVIIISRNSISKQIDDFVNKTFGQIIETKQIFQETDILPSSMAPVKTRQKPWGTAHAVWVAKGYIKTPFIVLNADDYYGYESFKLVTGFLRNNSPGSCLPGYLLKNTVSEYGSVSRGICEVNDKFLLKRITEHEKIWVEKGQILSLYNDKITVFTGEEFVSMNMWGFYPDFLEFLENEIIEFLNENLDEPTKEIYLPLIVAKLIGKQDVKVLPGSAKWLGITYPEDKAKVQSEIAGLVTMNYYPTKLWPDVKR